MLAPRTIISLVTVPILLAIIYFGGPVFLVLFIGALTIAGWEFARLFKHVGYNPSNWLVSGGVFAMTLARHFYAVNGDPFGGDIWLVPLFLLVSITYFLVQFEKGDNQAGTNFALTVAGFLYIGVLGGYLITLRTLPDGVWWWLTVLPSVWLADSGAYLFGSRFGKHKMTKRLSPKKSWEGYFAGVISASLFITPFIFLWQRLAGHPIGITLWNALPMAVVLAAIVPLGDLGISMFKRQVGVKDTGNVIPGHGGFLDRLDSWVWGATLGYWWIVTLIL